MRLKQLFMHYFSYFMPIKVSRIYSKTSGYLELSYQNGQIVVDSPNTNYSYGSLQRILRKGLLHIGESYINKCEHILLLGVAGGSVIKTLIEEFKYDRKITGIEIDEAALTLAKDFYKIEKYPQVALIQHEAFEFVLKTRLKFDLIIIDIFEDSTMPSFLFESFFQERIGFLLNPNGFVLFNTMLLNKDDNERNKLFVAQIDKNNYTVTTLPRVEEHNELIVIQKKG